MNGRLTVNRKEREWGIVVRITPSPSPQEAPFIPGVLMLCANLEAVLCKGGITGGRLCPLSSLFVP